MANVNLGAVTAYGIARKNGFVGTEAEWLASLHGSDGTNGSDYVLTDADKQEIIAAVVSQLADGDGVSY